MPETIPGPVGPLEALFRPGEGPLPSGVPPAALVCHPHPAMGGTLHNKVVYSIARGLLISGVAVLRFNFRGVGLSAGTYDEGRGERDDIRAGLDALGERFPGAPLLLAGFSFGAWHGLHVAEDDQRVARMIAVGLPGASYGFFECTGRGRPGLFVSGERDIYCPPDAVRRVVDGWTGPAEGVIARGADHFFDLVPDATPRGGADRHLRAELEGAIWSWLQAPPRRAWRQVG